jgi:adenosylcobinamide-phosphate synthase
MLGYRNARYEYFGKFAAKLDDVVNFIPARLAAFFLWLASWFCGLDGKAAWQIYWRDRKNHLSPNSGHPEAVAAGALGLALGGTHTYGGQTVVKPTIGQEKRLPDIEDIDRVVKLLNVAAILALALLLLGRYAWERFIW